MALADLYLRRRINNNSHKCIFFVSISHQFKLFIVLINMILAIQSKHRDWKEFLVKRLTGARTLPTNFRLKIFESLKSKFR